MCKATNFNPRSMLRLNIFNELLPKSSNQFVNFNRDMKRYDFLIFSALDIFAFVIILPSKLSFSSNQSSVHKKTRTDGFFCKYSIVFWVIVYLETLLGNVTYLETWLENITIDLETYEWSPKLFLMFQCNNRVSNLIFMFPT